MFLCHGDKHCSNGGLQIFSALFLPLCKSKMSVFLTFILLSKPWYTYVHEGIKQELKFMIEGYIWHQKLCNVTNIIQSVQVDVLCFIISHEHYNFLYNPSKFSCTFWWKWVCNIKVYIIILSVCIINYNTFILANCLLYCH